jgi:ArsR family metal-binding transcriptional regulator
MLINDYTLELAVSRHSDQEIEYEVIAKLTVDIGPVMPYLNATISRAIYVPAQPSVSWRHEGHNVAFWQDRIAAEDFASKEEAEQFIQRLVDMVHEPWERRDQIEPDHTTHQRLQPLKVLQLLPRTNCRQCGEETCFNFALKLVADQMDMSDCKPLVEDDAFRENSTRLAQMVATHWPAI